MDRAAVDAWLGRYVAAWQSGDSGEIGELFAEDARYRYHPADEPVAGREAIVASWLEEPDEPGTFEAGYECFAVDGDRAVAIGTSTYARGDVYDNVFLLEFDADSRCTQFTELYAKRG